MVDSSTATTKNEAPKAVHPCRRSILAAIVVSLLAWLCFEFVGPISDAESYFVDHRLRTGRMTAPNTNLVYITVDRVSYHDAFPDAVLTNAGPDDRYFMEVLRGEFPWNRELFAETVNQLANLGASKILLNFTFASEKPEDAEFMQTLNRHAQKVMIGASFHVGQNMIGLRLPSTTLIKPDQFGDVSHDHRIGFVSVHTDADGICRRGLYDLSMNQIIQDNFAGDSTLVLEKDMILPSFSSRLMRSFDRGEELPPPSHHPLLRYTGPRGTFETISLKSLFDPDERRTRFADTGFFKDKIVMVGPGQAVLPEEYRTLFRSGESTMDGSELHLNYLNAALQEEWVIESGPTQNRLIILASGVLLFALVFLTSAPLARILGGCALAGVWLLVTFWLYDQQNLMISAVITPMLLLIIGGIAIALFARPAAAD